MVVNEILRRSCLNVRIVVESVSGWFWNECPDQPGITVRMLAEWVSEWARNPQVADSEGLKVKTTAQKLLQTLWDSSPIRPDDSCFLGQVDYLEQNVAVQRVANEVRGARLDAFSGGLGHAQSLLIKRPSFDHEREIRLIFVEHREDHDKASVLPIRIDPNALFEEIILDPRLHADDVLERSAELKALGYTGPVNKSDLYQGTFHQIVLT